jgi:hypothetical protein
MITLGDVSVFVMEFVRAQRDGIEVLIPTAYGAELAGVKGRRDQATRERWPIEAFAEWGDQHDQAGMPAYRAMRDRLLELGWRMNGGRASTPALNASIDVGALDGTRKSPITMQTDEQRGMRLNMRFMDFASMPELVERIAVAMADAVPGLFEVERLREVGFAAQPRVAFAQLSPEMAVAMVDALTAALGEDFSPAQEGQPEE